ncbi:MAG: pyridoxal-dependent decarboxylase [Endozoicomonas sp.]|uniref:pyridoxal-dependent decarboxylase n=1 Tax=Endozoicomonas sp. TaxID=1892382 RepID=UPI003D9BC18D
MGTQFDEKAPAHKQEEAAQALYGTATIGSSEAVMLGFIAHKFIWNLKQRVLLDNSDVLGIKADARDRPVVLMSSQVHGCWDKFCRYYDATSLYIEVDGAPYALHDGDIVKSILETEIEDPVSPYAQQIRTAMGYKPGSQKGRCIGELVMAVGTCVGTTFTGNSDNVPAIDDAVDNFCIEQNKQYSDEQQRQFNELYQQEYARLYPQQPAPKRIPEIMDIPVHVDAASAGFVLMFSSSGSAIPFNFKECPKRVLSINISNHKFGMIFTGMGSVIFKDSSVVDPSLVYNIAYLGGSFDDYTVNFSRGSAMIVMQYYNFLRFGRRGYRDIMDNCVENSRWFVQQLESHPTLSQYFTNVSNISMTGDNEGMELPIIALTWADPDNPPSWDLVDMSDKLAQSGWVVPAYNIPKFTPEDTQGIQVLRIVVQQVVTRDKLNTLLQSMEVALNELNASGVRQTKRLVMARRNQCLC